MGERPNRLGWLGLRAPSSQPPKDDAAIVGAVRLLSVLIAALTMDLAGRKVLLFVSGECGRSPACPPFAPSAAALAGLGHSCPAGWAQSAQHLAQGRTSRKAGWGSRE